MSLKLYEFWLNVGGMIQCRFDDVNTRMIEKMIDLDISISTKSGTLSITVAESTYGLGPHTVIDGMLQKFRGRHRFRQYIPSKPGKYGIIY